MLSLVSAHSVAGLTDICYSKDGSQFLTCGQDGDIHVFETKSDKVEHIRCSDQCFCLAVHEYHLFVGTDRNELEVRSFPHGDSLPSLAHFTQPVSALYLSNSLLFVGTRDFKVVMMNLNEDSTKMKHFEGHQAPILALNVHSEKRWLATASCDGSVRIFNIDKQTLIKQLNVITKSNDIETASSLVKLDWDLTDHVLAIPVKNSIHFYETDKWTRKKVYENDSIDDVINLVSYSPCRTLFIVAYTNGQLSIVNRLTLDVCITYSTKDAVCSIAWNPSETHRCTCATMAGEYAHIDVSEYIAKPTSTPLEKEAAEIEKMTINSEDDDSESVSNDTEQVIDDKELLPNWIERTTTVVEAKPIELQESFQSTATSKYLESRFLLWNNIGAITCYSEQIQISFHDVSYHHSITIDNKTDKYSIGDLSLSAIVLASSQTGKLLCILYQSWDSNMREWTINTEKNEKIEVVSLGEDFLAIGTSQRFIRLMSLSGIQQRIIRLQGPIVSMSAYQNQLWIIQHSTQGLPKEQAMSYVLLDFANDHYLTGPLPLIPKTKLNWMGFSDSGKCFYLEKTGHLSMLRRTKGNNQLEPLLICNLKQEAEKNNTTSYWLLGINDFDGKFQLRVIELRGQSFPDLVPWPLVSIISLPLALYQIDTEKSQLESDYLKVKLFNSSNDDEEYMSDERQCLIKMFALSCKSNREYRAFEICQLMDSIALQLAVKYATKTGKMTLAQKITDELIEQKSDQELKQKEIQRSSSPPLPIPSYSSSSSSTISVSSTFEEIKPTRPKVTPPSGPFSNPFRKKALGTEPATTDELSKWKPSINKSRLAPTTKTTVQTEVHVEMAVENEDTSLNGKRKIDEDETNDEESGKNKRNKLRQFACNR